MPPVPMPHHMSLKIEAHNKWLKILKEAQELVENDVELQNKAAKGIRVKERRLPAETLGRMYGQYCSIINKLYDAYLNNEQLQRASYMMDIISVFIKRIYELRDEIVHLIVNDYIYVDGALMQTKLTPDNIQIVVPYHFPLECRNDTSELILQRMWAEAIKRKNAPSKKEKKPRPMKVKSEVSGLQQASDMATSRNEETSSEEEEDSVSVQPSEHTIISEDFLQSCIIQRHERFRQFFVVDFKVQCVKKRTYFAANVELAPLELRTKAAKLIQKTYRAFMKAKRQHALDLKRDMMLGLIPNPWTSGKSYIEENNKVYERRRATRTKLQGIFLKELEKEKIRLLFFKKEDQIDDVTESIKEWFKEWYYGYGFFPEYPYELEGGTLMVIRGEYPTIEEKIEADEKYLAATKGKTKEQLKQEAIQEKVDAEIKAELERGRLKKEAEVALKLRCNPFTDPGYQVKPSEARQSLIDAFQKYRGAWSIYDQFPPDKCGEVVYGFMQTILTEDLMNEIHVDCRRYVDELMRLDLKLLIKSHQLMYKRVGWKYPRMRPRQKPKSSPVPKMLKVDDSTYKSFEILFDMGIITKPTTKLKDVYGDYSYAAYDLNIRDPNASFPPPGYGDVKRRLVFSCIYGIGLSPGATRKKAVMLLGPPRNGKSFLVDAVAGELNAVKIDISPEVFVDAKIKPAKILTKVFFAARVFQPTVVFMKDVEKVFAKKVRPEDKHLQAKRLKRPLTKLIKTISSDEKVIFIGTCSEPMTAQRKPLVSLFNELILVPRTDYGTLRDFFYQRLQSIRSMPRDYNVQALAQLLQGYGFGLVIELFDKVVNPERIVRMNVTPLSPSEFMEPLIEGEIEPMTLEEYQLYEKFFLDSDATLRRERDEYAVINRFREIMYSKEAERKEKKEEEKKE